CLRLPNRLAVRIRSLQRKTVGEASLKRSLQGVIRRRQAGVELRNAAISFERPQKVGVEAGGTQPRVEVIPSRSTLKHRRVPIEPDFPVRSSRANIANGPQKLPGQLLLNGQVP